MRPGDQGCDPSQRLGRIEIEIGKQHGVVGDVRADDEQRVAVGRRRRDGLGADGGAATRPVLDDDVLADPVLQVLGDDAGERVDRAAGEERHDQLDGLCRIVLRPGRADGHRKPSSAAPNARMIATAASGRLISAATVLPVGQRSNASRRRYRRCRVPGGCAIVHVVVGAADAEVAARPSEARTTTFAPSCVRW